MSALRKRQSREAQATKARKRWDAASPEDRAETGRRLAAARAAKRCCLTFPPDTSVAVDPATVAAVMAEHAPDPAQLEAARLDLDRRLRAKDLSEDEHATLLALLEKRPR